MRQLSPTAASDLTPQQRCEPCQVGLRLQRAAKRDGFLGAGLAERPRRQMAELALQLRLLGIESRSGWETSPVRESVRPSFSRTVTTQPRPPWVGSMPTLLAQRHQVRPPRGGVAEQRLLEGVLAAERQRGGHPQRELALQARRRRLDVADAEVAGGTFTVTASIASGATRSSTRSWLAASIESWVR